MSINEPLISVIMPAKNAENFIAECLLSIQKQTHKNFECVICNDHSTDSTAEIIKGFIKEDRRFKLIKNEGVGIIHALQSAYRISLGAYITRMDADDIMPENKLSLLLETLLNQPEKQLSTGLVKYFPEDLIEDGYAKYEKWLNSLVVQNNHFEDVYRECVIASPNWLVSRNNFELAGGFKSSLYPEDYDLVFRFYAKGFKIAGVPEITHLWRDHQDRTSRNHIYYKDQYFLNLKLHYYFQIDYQPERQLVLWGAGLKGKMTAKYLKKKSIPFLWCCNNEKKYGKKIYEIPMHPYSIIEDENIDYQILIAISQRNAGKEIEAYFDNLGLEKNSDYYFFC